MVANVGRLQGGVKLLIEAAPDDGLLDVAVLTPRTLRHWAVLGWAVFRRNRRVPSMQVLQGARVEVFSDRPQPRQLDADVIDASNRLFAVMHPDAVWLCVPQPAEHPDLAEDADTAARRGSRLIENGQ
jgi:diacylglycerol kinase family enzyme